MLHANKPMSLVLTRKFVHAYKHVFFQNKKSQFQTIVSRSLCPRRRSRCSRTPTAAPSQQTPQWLRSCLSMTKAPCTNAWPPYNFPRLWTMCKSCCLCVTCSANCKWPRFVLGHCWWPRCVVNGLLILIVRWDQIFVFFIVVGLLILLHPLHDTNVQKNHT